MTLFERAIAVALMQLAASSCAKSTRVVVGAGRAAPTDARGSQTEPSGEVEVSPDAMARILAEEDCDGDRQLARRYALDTGGTGRQHVPQLGRARNHSDG